MFFHALRIAGVILALNNLLFANAQQSDLNLSGYTRISDEELPFTHVYLKAAQLGVISGTDGRFSLRVPANHKNDTLVFRHVGYQDLEIPVIEMIDREDAGFVLQESSLILQEVVVVNKKSFLARAFEPFGKPDVNEEVLTRKALFGFLQKEQGKFTSFEEFVVKMTYTKEDGWPTKIGIAVDAQRKSFDYSRFPKISSKKQKEGIQGPFYTGRSILQFLGKKAREADFEKMELSEMYNLDEERILIYAETGEGRDYLYHIAESDGQIRKVVIHRRNRIAYWHTPKFSNSNYSNYFFRSATTIHLQYSGDFPEVTDIESRSNTQYLDRLTGVVESSHEDITRIHFITSETRSNDPYKARDLFERPVFLGYDANFWSASNSLINNYELDDLEVETSLQQQFSTTNNDLVIKNAISGLSLSKSAIKDARKNGNIVTFLQLLKSNKFSPSDAILLDWDDIDELIQNVDDTTIISRFPRNVKSRFYVPEATLGIISMWLIESIRLNEAKKKPTGWFASALPVLKDRDDILRDKEADDGKGFFVPYNTISKQDEAVEYYRKWWEGVATLESSQGSKIPIFPKEMEWF